MAASETPERRVALIHRVILPDEKVPKEFSILVTDRRSIFIRQQKTRSAFVLRGEMRYGTALVTDVVPGTIEDYNQVTLESLAADSENLAINHDKVVSLDLKKEHPSFRIFDLWVWLTMKMQKEIFQVYHFEMTFRQDGDREGKLKFYMVPLGAWFKPRRQVETRETILREYAAEGLKVFREVLPPERVTTQISN